MASLGGVMAMGPGAEVYLSPSSAPISQWPSSASRFGGPRFYLSSSSSSLQQQQPRTTQPVLTLPRRSSPQLVSDVAGKPSAASDSSRSLVVQNGTSPDEGFFRKRRGEGMSSGGGPSALSLFPRTETSSSTRSVTEPFVAPTTGLQPLVERSEPEGMNPDFMSPRRPFQKDSVYVHSPATNGYNGKVGLKPDEGQPTRRLLEKRSPRNRQQSAEVLPTQQPAGRVSATTFGGQCEDHDLIGHTSNTGKQRRRGLSEGPIERVRKGEGLSETPVERSRTGEGLSETPVERSRTGEGLKGGRRGEGKSSGGGPSSISFGSPDEMSRSHSVDVSSFNSRCEAGRFSPSAPGNSSPIATRTLDDGCGSSITRTPSTVEPPRSSIAESQSANFSDTGREGRPSYDDLLAENQYLRRQLADAQNELASYRRWYG